MPRTNPGNLCRKHYIFGGSLRIARGDNRDWSSRLVRIADIGEHASEQAIFIEIVVPQPSRETPLVVEARVPSPNSANCLKS